MNWFSGKLMRVVLLPLVLSAAVVLGLGSYCETNDDQTMAWLFSGVLAAGPVASLPLYLHGYGHLLAAAYSAVPGVPWLGLLLGLELLGATVLTFAILDKLLRAYLRPGPLALVLTLFFGLAWLEHWLWFSHGRVALLLAGAGVLYAAQRPARRGALLLGLGALAAAWLIRPGFAVVGMGAVVPAALLLAGHWRRAVPLLASVALGLLLAMALLHLQQTPTEARIQRRDASLGRILDYNQRQPQPRTPADSLGVTAVSLWLLGDFTVVSEAFVQRVYPFNAADFLTREMPTKLRLRLGLLGRDYFPLLLALAASAVAMMRRRKRTGWFWLVQLAFAGGFLVLAASLKLPPRLALPLLDFWLLTNLVFWLKSMATTRFIVSSAAPEFLRSRQPSLATGREKGIGLPRLAAVALLAAATALYAAKTAHRYQVLSQERRRHEAALAIIGVQEARLVRILAGTNDLLKSLSPFRAYRLGRQPVLLLTGWSGQDASQARLCQALSGTADQAECLRRLGRLETYGSEADALWVLTPETARWLNRRFALMEPRLQLGLGPQPITYDADSTVWRYHVEMPDNR